MLTQNNPLENSTYFPLCKRGIEGDFGRSSKLALGSFCITATLKSPLTPLLQRGESDIIAEITSNEQSGLNVHRRISRARQAGVTLVITLIVLVAMTLATIALMRSVDTTNIIAGNLAFQRATSLAADAGTEEAIRVALPFLNTSGQLASANCASGLGYNNVYEPNLEPPAPGVTWETWWNGLAARGCPKTMPTDALGNTVSYIIERLCNTAEECLVSPPGSGICSGCNLGKAGEVPEGPEYQYYRITSRSEGPRNTVSYVQTIIAM